MNILNIERLTNTDRIRLINLITEMNNDYIPPLDMVVEIEVYAQKLLENATVLLALLDGKEAGFIAFYANDLETKVGYISSVGVLEFARGQSVGKRLIKEACHMCIRIGMESVALEVSTKNTLATNLYRFYKNPINIR